MRAGAEIQCVKAGRRRVSVIKALKERKLQFRSSVFATEIQAEVPLGEVGYSPSEGFDPGVHLKAVITIRVDKLKRGPLFGVKATDFLVEIERNCWQVQKGLPEYLL